jgi:hypothetical protein
MRYLRLLSRRSGTTANLGQSAAQSHQRGGGHQGGRDKISADPAHQTKKKSSKTSEAIGVAAASEESQEVDRKIAKELSCEIEQLGNTLQEREVYISHLLGELEVLRRSGAGAEGAHEERAEGEVSNSKSRRDAAKLKLESSSKQVSAMYAFIVGGLLMFVLSAVVSWLRSRFHVASNISSSSNS